MMLILARKGSVSQRKFRFGIPGGIVNSRLLPTILPELSYLTAAPKGRRLVLDR